MDYHHHRRRRRPRRSSRRPSRHDDDHEQQEQQRQQQQSSPLQQHDHDYNRNDPNMTLYDDEIRWAHRIKRGIQESSHRITKPVCDFEIAQWAVVTLPLLQQQAQQQQQQQQREEQRETKLLQQVLDRIYKLQYFRELYKIETVANKKVDHDEEVQQDTTATATATTATTTTNIINTINATGIHYIQQYVEQQQPGHLLSIDYMSDIGNYLIVWDRAAFMPSRIRTQYDWTIYQCTTYYIFLILNSNLRAVRTGVSVILECDNMKLCNYDVQFEERRVTELFGYYPFKNREFCFLNTPTVAILLYKICKPFLSKEFHKAVQLDGKIEGLTENGQRIDVLYNSPTKQIAQTRLLQRLQIYLHERLQNELYYVLPSEPTTAVEIPVEVMHHDDDDRIDGIDDMEE